MSTSMREVIPILRVERLSTSVEYYETVLGFTQLWSTGDFTSLQRDRVTVFLCDSGQGNPGTWLWIDVDDLDLMYEECRSRGAEIETELTSFPWGREFRVVDPDGHILRIGGGPEDHEHGPDTHEH